MIYVFIVFLVFLVMDVPVAFTIDASGMVFFLLNTHFPLTHIVQLSLTQVQSISVLTIPLFILAGNLTGNGEITKRLVSFATLLAGRMRGGLVQISVVLNTLMGGVPGSATTDAAMEARLLGPDMVKSEYSKGFSANVLTFASLITAMIPPGVDLTIYSTTGSVPIRKLFSAGIFMGLCMMIVLMVSMAAVTRMRSYKPVRQNRATWKEIGVNLKEAVWAIVFSIILLVSVRVGFSSPSEAGAFACFYSVFVGTFTYKELTIKSFITALRDSIADIGFIIMIASLTALFGYGMPIDKIPQKITTFITGIITNSSLVLILIIILLVFVGMFMGSSVVMLPLTPILFPMCQSMGIDPVHLGLLMCVIVAMGANTPPVGMSMYTANTILDCSLQEYTKSMIPFLTATLLAIGLLAFLSDIVLFLPRLLY